MRKRRSYFKVPNALIFDTTLSFATRRVGMIFFAYCNALGGCRKSYEAIAALAGCSVATAVKAVRELSEAGYLTVKHTKYHSGKLGRTVYGKNTYTVDLALLKKGYTILDRAVLEQELTDSALIVLCAIIVCAGNSSRAFPSISALQKKTGAARSTVCAGLRLLRLYRRRGAACSRPLKPCWCSSASRRTRSIVAIPITSAASQRAIMQRLLVTSISQLRMRVKPRSRAFL